MTDFDPKGKVEEFLDLEWEMEAVVSSNIQDVGWRNGKMRVRFLSGALYEYSDVPKGMYDKVRNAASPGSTFYQLIRGSYADERLE